MCSVCGTEYQRQACLIRVKMISLLFFLEISVNGWSSWYCKKKMSVHIVANVMPHNWCYFEIPFSHSEDFLFESRKNRPILPHWYGIWCHGWMGFRFPKSSAWAEEYVVSKWIPFIPYASSLWIQIKLYCWDSHQHSTALLIAVRMTHCVAIASLAMICSGCELCLLCGPTSEISLPHMFFDVMAICFSSSISHKNTQIFKLFTLYLWFS